jgi:hypothetical protein
MLLCQQESGNVLKAFGRTKSSIPASGKCCPVSGGGVQFSDRKKRFALSAFKSICLEVMFRSYYASLPLRIWI